MKGTLKAGFILAGLFIGIALGRDLGAVAISKMTTSSSTTTS